MRVKGLVVGLGCAALLAACSDSTGPGDEFNAIESAEDVAAIGDVFDTDAFKSLEALGGSFSSATPSPAMGAVMTRSGWEMLTAEDQASRHAAVERMAASVAAAPPSIPEGLLGRTYVYNQMDGEYVWDAERTGAPTNGIRLILYAINPVTEDPTEEEIGHVDLLDEGTDIAHVVRVVVTSDGTQFVNYTVSASGTVGVLEVAIAGFLTDGTDRVDLELSVTVTTSTGSISTEIDYVVEVNDGAFRATAELAITVDLEAQTGTFTLAATFQQGDNTVQLAGSLDAGNADGSGTVTLTVNGETFALITVTTTSVTVTNGEGGALTLAEVEAVEEIFEGFEELFDETFEDLFDPVEWLFDT